MKEFLIILAINFLLSLIAFYINYKSVEKGYLLRTALFEFLLCSIPCINIIFIISEIIDYICPNISEKFNGFLDKKVK